MQHFTSAQIASNAATVSDALDAHILLDLEDAHYYATGPIEALPVAEFYIPVELDLEVEPEMRLSRRERHRTSKAVTKARDLARHCARAAKRSMLAF